MYIYIACYSPTLNFCYLPIPCDRKRQFYHWYSGCKKHFILSDDT